MRKYLPAFAFLLTSFNCLAQGDFGVAYTIGVPMQTMAKHIQPAHQAVFSGNYRLPVKSHPQFWAGLELGVGNYAHKTIEQTFKFSDGSSTVTDVRYSSNIFYVNAVFRYDIPLKGKVTPYVKLTGGATEFYTSIYIEDPNNPGGCEALDKDMAMKDAAMSYSYGGGLRIQLKNRGKYSCLLDLGASSMRGGTVDYLNVKHLGEHDHNNTGGTDDSKPYNARFINVNTQDIHEHQLAQVYSSPIRLLQLKLGFVIQFNPDSESKGEKKSHKKSKCHGRGFAG